MDDHEATPVTALTIEPERPGMWEDVVWQHLIGIRRGPPFAHPYRGSIFMQKKRNPKANLQAAAKKARKITRRKP
jgi:hypothetical protein